MTSSLARATDILEATLLELAEHHNGFSGNCARVARVLDEVLDTGGDYVVVVGEHYEFADHVFLRWNDRLWDMNGAHTEDQAQAQWCQVEDEDEDEDTPTLEDFTDPGGAMVGRMADSNNVLAGEFTVESFRADLTRRLREQGFHKAYPQAVLEEDPGRLEAEAGTSSVVRPNPKLRR